MHFMRTADFLCHSPRFAIRVVFNYIYLLFVGIDWMRKCHWDHWLRIVYSFSWMLCEPVLHVFMMPLFLLVTDDIDALELKCRDLYSLPIIILFKSHPHITLQLHRPCCQRMCIISSYMHDTSLIVFQLIWVRRWSYERFLYWKNCPPIATIWLILLSCGFRTLIADLDILEYDLS